MSAPYDCPDVELHYITLDNAGSVLKKLGKFDVTAAYKQIRLIIDDWCLQGEMYEANGATCFDIATATNFGAKSSGYLWEEYGSALEFIFRWSVPLEAIMRYVDDFIVMIRPYKPVSNTDRLTLAREQILNSTKTWRIARQIRQRYTHRLSRN